MYRMKSGDDLGAVVYFGQQADSSGRILDCADGAGPPDVNVLHNTKRIYAKTFFVQVGSRGMILNHNRKLIFRGNRLFSKSRLAGFGSAANRAEDLGVWT